VKGFCL